MEDNGPCFDQEVKKYCCSWDEEICFFSFSLTIWIRKHRENAVIFLIVSQIGETERLRASVTHLMRRSRFAGTQEWLHYSGWPHDDAYSIVYWSRARKVSFLTWDRENSIFIFFAHATLEQHSRSPVSTPTRTGIHNSWGGQDNAKSWWMIPLHDGA